MNPAVAQLHTFWTNVNISSGNFYGIKVTALVCHDLSCPNAPELCDPSYLNRLQRRRSSAETPSMRSWVIRLFAHRHKAVRIPSLPDDSKPQKVSPFARQIRRVQARHRSKRLGP